MGCMTNSSATKLPAGNPSTGSQVEHTSHCPLDCPDQCSLTVTLEADRVVKVTGSELNPFTKGVICSKVRDFGDRVHSPERIATPLVRKACSPKGPGAEFEPIGWPDAIAKIAQQLTRVKQEHGGEAILPVSYGGSNGAVTEGMLDERLWRRLGASRLDRTLCAAASGAAHNGLMGKMPGTDLRDYEYSNLIVIWGQNPKDSGMHLVPTIKAAQKRGAKLVVIDPRSTGLARSADLHLAIRPGTDLCLALAIHRIFFEAGWQADEFLAAHTTGADQLRAAAEPWTLEAAAAETHLAGADMQRLAELLHESSPAVIRGGWGPERNRNGGSALAAVYALAAVCGTFGPRGGGLTVSQSRALPISKEATINALQQPELRQVSLNQVGRALLGDADVLDGGPTPALAFIYNCNAISTLPNQRAVMQGLRREDLFTIVFEQVMTDTTYYADIVLPATTFLEHDEVVSGYGATFLAHARAIMEPLAEARSNPAVFADLLDALDLAEEVDAKTESAIASSVLAETVLTDGQRRELAASSTTVPAFELENGRPSMPFVDHFPPTPDQKMHLFPAALDAEAKARAAETGAIGGLYVYQPDPATKAHPLALISPAMGRMTTSTFGESYPGPAPLYMNAADAAARGIADGAGVRVFNRLGEVHVRAQIGGRDEPSRGTVVLHKGLWARHTSNGLSSNTLSPDHLSDLGGNACFNDARVEVAAR
jgi:anaerobic selenocysteine-containing dehydrogenase